MSNPLPLPPMRHLRVFESAARLGGFSAAAQELHTTQSAVSRTVADLERLLGTALFERVHRGVRLTRGDAWSSSTKPPGAWMGLRRSRRGSERRRCTGPP